MTDFNRKELLELVEGLFTHGDGAAEKLMEVLVNILLEAEMTDHLGAEPYERTPARRGQRNGTYTREMTCRIGSLELRVPRDRDGEFSTQLFDRFQRHERALEQVFAEMYVQGVSTRRVGRVAERLFGHSISAQTVSNMAKDLDEALEAWRSEPFEGEYPYLSVDARYEKVRVDGRVISMAVLIAIGVTEKGKRRVLDFAVEMRESEPSWTAFFKQLKERGLTGVQLVTSDAHQGLVEALQKAFPGASWQRCQMHFIRNAKDKVPKRKQGELHGQLRAIFDSFTLEKALELKAELVREYETHHAELARMLDEKLGDCLAVFHFPAKHRRRLRTTNGSERLNEEIKRRTHVVRIFPNRAAVVRLVGTLLMEQDEEWRTNRSYMDMSHLARMHADEDTAERT